MKKVLKIIIISLICITFLFVWGMFFSYVFPKSVPPLDTIRMHFQSKILNFAGEAILGDITTDEFWYPTHNEDFLSREDIVDYIDTLEVGDIIFTESDQYLSSIKTPWKRTHSAIYLGERKILDASSEWVLIRDIDQLSNISSYSFLKSLLAFRINTREENIQTFVDVAKQQIGKEYNFDFDTDDTASFYCSQLIKYGLEAIGFYLPTSETFLREITSPDDAANYMLWSGTENNEYFPLFFLEKQEGKTINHFSDFYL